ncbi:hypothetical protein BU14_0953s0003 [Porphyra umbilicalis]|uniref:Uncharacterized protein n=1 Tax=Porphyra umbilicalis TaxID=2786 RepID=A0A1X6NN90_PORUM|nr:hypothetical protein BU14_0953s0003 [Porphyra umbilicalis]|eukprot:OSX70010.1 hypothetical protein BU14_0953s0003 [Porphyra umbilicalis]
MGAVVAKLGAELWGFSYTCMAAEADETAANRAAFAVTAGGGGAAAAAVPSWMTFATSRWWKEGFGGGAPPAGAPPPTAAAATDAGGGGGGTGAVGLVFAWDVLAHTPYGRVWGFFVRARQEGVGLVLFDNYPGLVNNPSPKRRYLNVRKHPFKFGPAAEVVQNVTEGGGKPCVGRCSCTRCRRCQSCYQARDEGEGGGGRVGGRQWLAVRGSVLVCWCVGPTLWPFLAAHNRLCPTRELSGRVHPHTGGSHGRQLDCS